MQFIKQLIFGKRRKPVESISTGFHSLYPKNPPSFEEWCKEFRVGMLYDRKVIHL
jgi:hypothetical protein